MSVTKKSLEMKFQMLDCSPGTSEHESCESGLSNIRRAMELRVPWQVTTRLILFVEELPFDNHSAKVLLTYILPLRSTCGTRSPFHHSSHVQPCGLNP